MRKRAQYEVQYGKGVQARKYRLGRGDATDPQRDGRDVCEKQKRIKNRDDVQSDPRFAPWPQCLCAVAIEHVDTDVDQGGCYGADEQQQWGNGRRGESDAQSQNACANEHRRDAVRHAAMVADVGVLAPQSGDDVSIGQYRTDDGRCHDGAGGQWIGCDCGMDVRKSTEPDAHHDVCRAVHTHAPYPYRLQYTLMERTCIG